MRSIQTSILMLSGAAIALGMAGCNQQRTDDTLSDATPEASAPADAKPSALADQVADVADAMAAAKPDASEPQLTVSSAGAEAPYIVDGAGRALYLLEGDDNAGKCTDACLQTWPPVLVAGTDVRADVAPRLQADMVGTLQRPDGTVQLTYNGHPLYRYAVDDGAGSIAGQDLTDQWGEWYLVTPEGTPLELHDEPA